MAQVSGLVSNPQSIKNVDGSVASSLVDRHGGLIVRELGGRYFDAAQRGNVFMSATALAGVTVPVGATTLASKAGMQNPNGSTINLELIGIMLGGVTVDVAVKDFFMEFQVNTSTTGGIPTSVTKLTTFNMPLSAAGGPAAQGWGYSAATMTNAAANPLVLPIFGHLDTAVGFRQSYFKFDGEIVMGPDTCMAITVATTAIAAVQVGYVWAEWPI